MSIHHTMALRQGPLYWIKLPKNALSKYDVTIIKTQLSMVKM